MFLRNRFVFGAKRYETERGTKPVKALDAAEPDALRRCGTKDRGEDYSRVRYVEADKGKLVHPLSASTALRSLG